MTTEHTKPLAPIAAAERIAAFGVVRGFALIRILSSAAQQSVAALFSLRPDGMAVARDPLLAVASHVGGAFRQCRRPAAPSLIAGPADVWAPAHAYVEPTCISVQKIHRRRPGKCTSSQIPLAAPCVYVLSRLDKTSIPGGDRP